MKERTTRRVLQGSSKLIKSNPNFQDVMHSGKANVLPRKKPSKKDNDSDRSGSQQSSVR